MAAQHLSPHEVQCVTPATHGGRWFRAGITPNNGGEHEWGDGGDSPHSFPPAVYIDPLLLVSMESDGRGGQDTGVGMPPGGPARGNTPFEIFHITGRFAAPLVSEMDGRRRRLLDEQR